MFTTRRTPILPQSAPESKLGRQSNKRPGGRASDPAETTERKSPRHGRVPWPLMDIFGTHDYSVRTRVVGWNGQIPVLFADGSVPMTPPPQGSGVWSWRGLAL